MEQGSGWIRHQGLAACLSLPAMCSRVSEFPKSQLNHHMEQGQEIHTGLAPRASCYQGKTQSARDKYEDGQTSRQRICMEHCWAIVSNSSWVRKNSKYLTLSREVRKWTKMWQTISEVRKFLSKIPLQPTFSSVLKLNSKALHYFPIHKRWRHTICLKNQNYSCSTSAVYKFWKPLNSDFQVVNFFPDRSSIKLIKFLLAYFYSTSPTTERQETKGNGAHIMQNSLQHITYQFLKAKNNEIAFCPLPSHSALQK